MCIVNHFCLSGRSLSPSLSIPFQLCWSGATFFVIRSTMMANAKLNPHHAHNFKCHVAYATLYHPILCHIVNVVRIWMDGLYACICIIFSDNHINHLTSYHLSVSANLKCHRYTGIYMEKYDEFMRLRALWMCWTVVLVLKPWSKMKYRLHNGPWTGISLNRNRCCFEVKKTGKKRNEIIIHGTNIAKHFTYQIEFTCWFRRIDKQLVISANGSTSSKSHILIVPTGTCRFFSVEILCVINLNWLWGEIKFWKLAIFGDWNWFRQNLKANNESHWMKFGGKKIGMGHWVRKFLSLPNKASRGGAAASFRFKWGWS